MQDNYYICENYPHPINNVRFDGFDSALDFAKGYYGLPKDHIFSHNGMCYIFTDKNGKAKGFRIILENIRP